MLTSPHPYFGETTVSPWNEEEEYINNTQYLLNKSQKINTNIFNGHLYNNNNNKINNLTNNLHQSSSSKHRGSIIKVEGKIYLSFSLILKI